MSNAEPAKLVVVAAVTAAAMFGSAAASESRGADAASQAALPAADQQPGAWTMRCPRTGLTLTAEDIETRRPVLVRTYRGNSPSDPALCIVEDNGALRSVLFQMFADGSEITTQIRPLLNQFFPAAPGKRIVFTSFAQAEGRGAPLQNQYRHDLTYTGVAVLEVSGRPMMAHEILYREVGLTNNYAASSRYYFDQGTGVLVRFEHRHERGRPRNVASWQANREIR